MLFPKQNPCLIQRDINLDEIVFSTQVCGSRRYSSLPDKDCYARFVLSEKDGSAFCNELLWTDCFAYLDLDSPLELQSLGFTQPEFITAFNALLTECFQKHLDVALAPHDLLWSCSSRPGKLSYHIKIAGNYYWPKEQRKAEMKDFFKLVDAECMNTKGFHYLLQDGDRVKMYSICDLQVYSGNRCMRSLNCKKIDSPPFRPVGCPISHSAIVNHMLTVTCNEKQHMQPYSLKTKTRVPQRTISIHTDVLRSLATEYGATYVKTEGSLVVLKNNGPRVCPLGGETNTSDNPYFVLKSFNVYYGCHNCECCGKLLKIHEMGPKEFEYYQDYMKLVDKPSTELRRSDVEEYIRSCVKWIDRPEEPFFVTLRKIGLECFNHQISSKQVSCSKSLFSRYADISLIAQKPDEEPEMIKFSKVLGDLLKRRQIPTYSDVIWQPFLNKSNRVPKNKLNLFQGFALENVPSEGIDFEKTQMCDLLHKLCGNSPVYIKYLFNFIAAKLQRPAVKHPICLAFINSREGAGKGSFGEFLKRLFACGENTFVSFNSLTSFANSFNGIQSRALFIVLEEVSAKKGGLKEWRGLLKDKISSTTLLLERKNQERVQTNFYANIIIFSNEFQVLSCSTHDRRFVFFSSDNSKANDREFFVKLYAELNSLPHMKAAFDFFSKWDTTKFNYRKITHSRIKDKLAQCSEKNVTKFHRYLFKTCYYDQAMYTFSEADLYSHYKDFVQEYGVNKQSDRHHVCANLELYMNLGRDGEYYILQDTERRRYLSEM